MVRAHVRLELARLTGDLDHPQKTALLTILTGDSGLDSAGHPVVGEPSWRLFLREVPHLFLDGQRLLAWLTVVRQRIDTSAALSSEERERLTRILGVLRRVVLTAAVCAPTDLWLLRQVLGAHQALGTTGSLRRVFTVPELSRYLGLREDQLGFDVGLLHARGLLTRAQRGFQLDPGPKAREAMTRLRPLDPADLGDLVPWLHEAIRGRLAPGDARRGELASYAAAWSASCLGEATSSPPARGEPAWYATAAQIELGFRLVPLVLAIRPELGSAAPGAGAPIRDWLPRLPPELLSLLMSAALVTGTGITTEVGARVFERGPGPFGILHAYHPYMARRAQLLVGDAAGAQVARADNVAASQQANRKTFELANAALDRFCRRYGFTYDVFIEHAVGQGEATRQRFAASGEASIRYFGADLEDAAIDRAVRAKAAGDLPGNMTFVRGADIGDPPALVRAVMAAGCATERAVMMVGNGFHEIRNQTDDGMVEIFRSYCQAGLVLVLTEESALGDDDLRATGWNTYHAGFRYVHQLSGQGLRPAHDDASSPSFGWSRCASLAGYRVLDEFTTRTRTIYPHARPSGQNPAISVSYFCVPEALASALGIPR